MSDTPTRSRAREERFEERRQQLAESALTTLAELGYARTSLREIAQHSEFTHGVVHYYFADKVELIAYCVRLFHARVVSRFDALMEVPDVDGAAMVLLMGERLRATFTEESSMHRLWYDLRTQSLFDDAFRDDVTEIERTLESFCWRVLQRYAELNDARILVDSGTVYRLLDGLFAGALVEHIGGDETAAVRLLERLWWVVQTVCPSNGSAVGGELTAAR